MPRPARGGSRQGTPGTQYANRTDLQQPKVPNETAPGQTYGKRTQQTAAQNVLPVAAPPGVLAPQGPPTAPNAQPQPPGGAGQAQSVPPSLPPGSPEPGEMNWTGPTQRPGEPVTTGSKAGPGPGPEVLTGVGAIANRAAPQDTATQLLTQLAAAPTAGSQLRDMARLAMETSK